MSYQTKKTIKKILILGFPILLQNLFVCLSMMSDTFIMGTIGSDGLLAIAPENTISYVYLLVISGIFNAFAIAIANSYGENNKEKIIKHIKNMKYVRIVVLFLSTLLIIFSGQIVALFIKNPVVLPQARIYFSIVVCSYIFMSLCAEIRTIFYNVQKPKVPSLISTAIIVINIILGFILVKTIGVYGPAISVLITRILEYICLKIYLIKSEYNIKFNFPKLDKEGKKVFKDSFLYALSDGGWAFSITLLMLICSFFGEKELVANQIAVSLTELGFIFLLTLSSVNTMLLGEAYGEKNFKEAKNLVKIFLVLCFITGIIGFIIINLEGIVFLNVYIFSSSQASLIKTVLFITAIYIPIRSVNAMLTNCFRACNRNAVVFIIDLGGAYLGVFALLIAYYLNTNFYFALIIYYFFAEVSKIIIGLYIMYKTSYVLNEKRNM